MPPDESAFLTESAPCPALTAPGLEVSGRQRPARLEGRSARRSYDGRDSLNDRTWRTRSTARGVSLCARRRCELSLYQSYSVSQVDHYARVRVLQRTSRRLSGSCASRGTRRLQSPAPGARRVQRRLTRSVPLDQCSAAREVNTPGVLTPGAAGVTACLRPRCGWP